MAPKRENRNAEWMLFRRTASLGDVVDESTFVEMCGIATVRTLREISRRRRVHGIDFPAPIFRPEYQKPLWIRAEAEAFARAYKAKKATRRKK